MCFLKVWFLKGQFLKIWFFNPSFLKSGFLKFAVFKSSFLEFGFLDSGYLESSFLDSFHRAIITINIIIVEVLDGDQYDHVILEHYLVASLKNFDLGQVG